jgi:predicted transcriptional regulator
MDLRIQKQKSEIIAKIQSCENPALLDEILSQLNKSDALSIAVEPLTEAMIAARLQEGIESIRRGETYTTEEVRAYLASNGRKV